MNMKGYVLFWYHLGVKLPWGNAHKTRSWYLLGVAFKKCDEHPRHFHMGVPPPPEIHLGQMEWRGIFIWNEFVFPLLVQDLFWRVKPSVGFFLSKI